MAFVRNTEARERNRQHTRIEDGIFAIVCTPERLPLVQSPLGGGSGFDIWVVRVRHV